MLNVLDKRRMLEGLTFNHALSRDASEAEMDALIEAKRVLRAAGLVLVADGAGVNIKIKRRDGTGTVVSRGLLL